MSNKTDFSFSHGLVLIRCAPWASRNKIPSEGQNSRNDGYGSTSCSTDESAPNDNPPMTWTLLDADRRFSDVISAAQGNEWTKREKMWNRKIIQAKEPKEMVKGNSYRNQKTKAGLFVWGQKIQCAYFMKSNTHLVPETEAFTLKPLSSCVWLSFFFTLVAGKSHIEKWHAIVVQRWHLKQAWRFCNYNVFRLSLGTFSARL